jgi:transposase InsO family protein
MRLFVANPHVMALPTERLEELGVAASIGTVGDSFDNAMAESMFALFKTELFRNPAVLASVGGTGRDSMTSK